MAQRTFRIRGTLVEGDKPVLQEKLVTVRSARRLLPGRARDGVTGEADLAADDIVRVELENGFVLWSRADDLIREYGKQALSRDGAEIWEFGRLVPQRAAAATRDERGLVGLSIKILDFFGIDLTEKAARKLCEAFEMRQLKDKPAGVYRCSLDDVFTLQPLAPDEGIPSAEGPLLVFLHGTASSTEGGFGKLWAPDNREGKAARERLAERYGHRVFALEHRSLTESPIANALALAEKLPAGAEIHLVSHSRGGLVGELLCLSGSPDLKQRLTDDWLAELFDPAHGMLAEQLGLSPLSEEEINARTNEYQQDRVRLGKFVQVLNERAFRVTRFVRVACPARGTTLASGRLDRWLSMLNYVSGDGLFGGAVDFLLAVVKERTDPRTLPGLEAMMPGSGLTRLLNHPELSTEADLTVIAGDIEGDSLWQKLKLLALDWFYGADHDLVVNTGSMSGGLRRPERSARFRKARGPDVNHFRYFVNRDSVGWLADGLTRAEGEDAGFLPLDLAQKEEPRWREAVARSLAVTTPRPLAVVLPGVMGSHLKAGGDHIWLKYRALAFGGLKKLQYGADGVVPQNLLDDFYGPLLEFLARTHRVEIFPYDWRLSVRDAAAKLTERLEDWLPRAEREQQPVHVVAHSMGGLVVRAMLTDRDRGAAVWQRLTRLPNSRFLMLGTPNLGSYEAVRWLTGFNPTQSKLALLDLTQNTDDLVNLVRDYPGLLELLPFGPDDPDFSEEARWQTIKTTTGARWKTADAGKLGNVRKTWALLRDQLPDPRYTRYVAGCQPATVVGYQFSDYDKPSPDGRKRLDFVATREGDGTVPWASGRLEGVGMWYVEDTAHDSLCTQKRAFAGYLDLLMTGQTTRLAASPPARARAAEGEPERFVLPPSPPMDGVPGEEDVAGFSFGGSPVPALRDERPAAPVLRVSIRHGDLCYARHPILVGHYLGDTIVSAERTLDRQMKGALSRRLDLGIYPGRLDTQALFFNEQPADKPGGAIVVGLGQVGELTPGLLEAGVRNALLEYALQAAQWPDERFGKAGGPRRACISCLLVGTGAGGIPIRDSVESILRGAVAVNVRLVQARMDNRVAIDEIEFLEVYEDMAIAAAEALRQVLAVGELAAAVRWPAEVVEAGRGGRRRVRFDEAPEWWHRLEIVEEKDRRDQLRFIFATDRARAEETLATGQLALAESFIREASRSASATPEAARTLFEMLLPLRLRELAPRQTALVLLVDEHSARYPWELLENRWSDNGRPPAVNAGLVRQLKSAEFRPRPAQAFENRALVVGNPDLAGWNQFSELPGARDEARKVADLLAAERFEVIDCIDEKPDAIIENLHRKPWRILHLAGHGVFDFLLGTGRTAVCPACQQARSEPERKISGMVIGLETFLTPGDVQQMRWVPELVFINCCHLGRTTGGDELDRGALAANLGVEFIRMGVRAVVAAGWAVDDAAALAFAETFYQRLLAGDPFGEAVRSAREEIWLRFPGVNTWGAYQCYGDPSYRLYRSEAGRPSQRRLYSAPSELAVDLENLASGLHAGGGPDADEGAKPEDAIAALTARIPDAQRAPWLARADVAAALGLAYGEARCWARAVEWLTRSLTAAQGDCPIRVVEQLANFRVRDAAETWAAHRDVPAQASRAAADAAATIREAIEQIETLSRFGNTEERWSLLGGSYKRLALIQTGKDRREALQRMAESYQQALALGKKVYAFTNWATAKILAGTAEAEDWDRFAVELGRLGEELKRSNEQDPNFWDSAALVDLDLVRLLVANYRPGRGEGKSAPKARGGGKPAVSKALPAEGDALVDRIIAGYRAAIQRGASPREAASVRENLAFVLAMIDSPADPLAAALRRIREAV